MFPAGGAAEQQAQVVLTCKSPLGAAPGEGKLDCPPGIVFWFSFWVLFFSSLQGILHLPSQGQEAQPEEMGGMVDVASAMYVGSYRPFLVGVEVLRLWSGWI